MSSSKERVIGKKTHNAELLTRVYQWEGEGVQIGVSISWVQIQISKMKLSRASKTETRRLDQHNKAHYSTAFFSNDGSSRTTALRLRDFCLLVALIMDNKKQTALEVQSPFSRLILSGKKTIETRAYPLPPDLIGSNIILCESLPGVDGVSRIGDEVLHAQEGLSLIGEIFISSSKEYESQTEWDSDVEKHNVPKGSSYDWSPTEIGRRYAWIIERVVIYDQVLPVPNMRRR
jgi:hypothetical protein